MIWQEITDALPLVLAAAAAGALVIAVVVAAARLARRQPRNINLPALRSDVAELAGELEDYARQIDRQVTERLKHLKTLLAEVDSKQQELRRLLEAAGKTATEDPGRSRIQNSQVLALASQGLDSVEIARRLQLDVGEVELIVNLYRSDVLPKP